MANFLELIFAQLQRADGRVVLREIHGETFTTITGRELLAQIQRGRSYMRKFGVVPGDRCALLGANSIQWVAVDLALMAEGVIVVPLYSRQAAAELVGMMKDCSPSLLIVGDAELGAAIEHGWRPGDDYLYLRHVRRTQGRLSERRKRDAHAAVHWRAVGSVDGRVNAGGRARGGGASVLLFFLLLRVVRVFFPR